MMLKISNQVWLPLSEIELQGVRAQGAGGQNVNKVSSAIHLRFNFSQSSLPEFYKTRLAALNDRRITREGTIVIKAQRFRTQEKNRDDALARLQELIRSVNTPIKARIATKPSKSSQKKRLDNKKMRSQVKAMRGKVL